MYLSTFLSRFYLTWLQPILINCWCVLWDLASAEPSVPCQWSLLHFKISTHLNLSLSGHFDLALTPPHSFTLFTVMGPFYYNCSVKEKKSQQSITLCIICHFFNGTKQTIWLFCTLNVTYCFSVCWFLPLLWENFRYCRVLKSIFIGCAGLFLQPLTEARCCSHTAWQITLDTIWLTDHPTPMM